MLSGSGLEGSAAFQELIRDDGHEKWMTSVMVFSYKNG
jgi:hypothetical protein